jgi:hypothetical protein
MKKTFTIIFLSLLASLSFAQNDKKASAFHSSNPQIIHSRSPKLINHTPLITHSVGDTVFVFDGSYYYNWNGTLPSTFAIKLEDLDNDTIEKKLQPGYGVKGSFSFFYDTVKTSNLHYGHADTVFYSAATSWFTKPAQANNWLELGPIHVPTAGGTLKWRHNLPDGKYRDGYEILINTTGHASTNFTNPPVFSVSDNDPKTIADTVNNVFIQYSANVSTYAGKDIYVAVHHKGNDKFLLLITDIILIEGTESSIAENGGIISSFQNIPNPASNNTTISFTLKESANIQFSLFDVAGKKLISLNKGNQLAGNHQFKLDVSTLSSGTYFYTISSGSHSLTNKMSISK